MPHAIRIHIGVDLRPRRRGRCHCQGCDQECGLERHDYWGFLPWKATASPARRAGTCIKKCDLTRSGARGRGRLKRAPVATKRGLVHAEGLERAVRTEPMSE